jgi:hypothetical protein
VISGQRGQALVIVLLLTTAVFIIGGAGLALSSTARKNAVQEVHQKKAYYIAEAGVERALLKLKTDPTWRDNEGDDLRVEYAGGKIESVMVADADESMDIGKLVEIESTGTFRSARSTLWVTALVQSPLDVFGGFTILPDEEESDFVFTGNVTITNATGSNGTGRVILRGNLTLSGNSKVDADLYISGQLTEKNKIEGSLFEYYSDIPPFPPVDEGILRRKALERNHFYSSEQNVKFGEKGIDISDLDQGDIYFVEGDMTISGTYGGGPAIIAATGNINIDDNLKMASDDGNLLVLVCLGDEKVVRIKKGNAEVEALIISHGGFDINGNAILLGATLAKHLVKPDNKLNGTLTIECEPELVMRSLSSFIPEFFASEVKIKSWQESYGGSLSSTT